MDTIDEGDADVLMRSSTNVTDRVSIRYKIDRISAARVETFRFNKRGAGPREGGLHNTPKFLIFFFVTLGS